MKTRSYVIVLVLSFFAVAGLSCQEELQEEVQEETNVSQLTVEDASPEVAALQTEDQKISYALGARIGGNINSVKKQDPKIDIELLMLGVQDVLDGKELALSSAENRKYMMAFQNRLREKQVAERAEQAEKNLAEGQAFLEENKTKEGVKVLESGLQYKVITEGTGETPRAEDKVKTHYRGKLISGVEFDSSYKSDKPSEFPVKGVIKGWTEALQLMKVGSKWELYIPEDLAYGKAGRSPRIPPNSTLIFEIELLEIME
jgi:FKBP-type peptidyl-prolyl cis-trans isomerase FklB